MSDPQQPQVPPYTPNAGQPQQPSYPPQGYAQPQPPYAQSAYATPVSTPTDSNAPGKIGFIIGAVSIVLQLILSAILQLAVHDFDVFTVVNSTFSTLIFLTALGALIFGLIGIRRAGAPQTLAGIATGIGIAITVSTAFYFIVSTLTPFLYF